MILVTKSINWLYVDSLELNENNFVPVSIFLNGCEISSFHLFFVFEIDRADG